MAVMGDLYDFKIHVSNFKKINLHKKVCFCDGVNTTYSLTTIQSD